MALIANCFTGAPSLSQTAARSTSRMYPSKKDPVSSLRLGLELRRRNDSVLWVTGLLLATSGPYWESLVFFNGKGRAEFGRAIAD